MNRWAFLVFCFSSCGALLGCTGGGAAPSGPSNPETGEAVYRETLSDGNSFTCSTCHALTEPAADGLRRPGHAIGDATRRPSYKNGLHTELLDAVNTCVTEWMNAAAFADDDPRWLALHAFLDAQATATEAPPISIEVVTPPSDVSGGDFDRGRSLFNGACIVCHGEDATGTVRAPALLGSVLEPDYIARRVRTSGREASPTYGGLTGGIMPFWGADRLSDGELLDLVAYVNGRSMETSAPVADAGAPDAAPPVDGGRSCASTHRSVGQTATLTTRFHGTTGTARIVDDCTIVIDDFGYDGTGIDVRFYGALGGDYGSGFSVSGDLLRSGGYAGETLVLTIPEGHTLDELDGLSLWCVDVGVSFGDGSFE